MNPAERRETLDWLQRQGLCIQCASHAAEAFEQGAKSALFRCDMMSPEGLIVLSEDGHLRSERIPAWWRPGPGERYH